MVEAGSVTVVAGPVRALDSPRLSMAHQGAFGKVQEECYNSVSIAAVPQASCRDCELEEASTTKEILENFCANDFSEYTYLFFPPQLLLPL